MNPKKYFENFDEGLVVNYIVPGLRTEEITEFAELYDPQRFHLDEEEAAKTHFGSLVASGFQTQLLCFRPFCETVLIDSGAVGAPGIDSLKWLRPWYPGEDLEVSVTLVSKRLSSKRTDRGYLGFEMKAETNGAIVLTMEWVVIMMTRAINA
ncbi:MAG: MaoC/PaaZ C-terminal domain-containing protein [Gammaproteobacteria bacterium]|nr:MaoC/PaaZ C-terminal domain-containing protein [Gammaproteobacteria bacterium]